MIESKLEVITPEMATKYLSHNVKNRSIRKQEVEAYAREIRRGTFVTTHQGIAFDENGALIDGQHRLMAIAAAGKPVQMMVTRGVSPQALTIIDRGASRTMRDVVALGDHGDDERAVMMRNGVMLSAMSQLVSCGLRKMKLTSSEALGLFDVFGDEALTAYRSAVTKRTIGRSQVVSAAIAAMHCGVSHEAISKFFNVFHKSDIRGCDGYNVRVALNWRRQIDDAKLQGMAMSNRRIYFGTQAAIWHFVNNTDVTRVVVPTKPKYDVSDVIKSVLGV